MRILLGLFVLCLVFVQVKAQTKNTVNISNSDGSNINISQNIHTGDLIICNFGESLLPGNELNISYFIYSVKSILEYLVIKKGINDIKLIEIEKSLLEIQLASEKDEVTSGINSVINSISVYKETINNDIRTQSLYDLIMGYRILNCYDFEPQSLKKDTIKSLYNTRLAWGNDYRIFSKINGIRKIKVNGKFGLTHDDSTFFVKPIYDTIYDFESGMAVVKSSNKFYVIDSLGKLIVSKDFVNSEEIYRSVNGVFRVKIKGGEYVFLNRKGERIFDLEFSSAGDYGNGLFPINMYGYGNDKQNTHKMWLGSKYKYEMGDRYFFKMNKATARLSKYYSKNFHTYFMYCDINGKIINQEPFVYASGFKGDYAIVQSQYEMGRKLVDLNFNAVTENYGAISPISDSLFVAKKFMEKGEFNQPAMNGQESIDYLFHNAEGKYVSCHYKYLILNSEGIAIAVSHCQKPKFVEGYIILYQNGMYGLASIDGQMILPFKFKSIEYLNTSLFHTFDGKEKLMLFVDNNQTKVLKKNISKD